MIVAVPDLAVTLDGVDLTPKIRGMVQGASGRQRPRLISLSISQRRGEEPDRLSLQLDDSDGALAIPSAGKLLQVGIGWRRGSGVTVGLVDKGTFKVDSIAHDGPPDTLTIEASSADMTGALRIRREETNRDTTLGAIVTKIAGRHGLTPRCAGALAGIAVNTHMQSRESDLAYLRRLGREHDAVATIKAGTLLLAPVGIGVTQSGRALPSVTINRSDGDRHAYRVDKEEEATGVTATWHDRKAAKRKTVTVGRSDGARKLRRVYVSEGEATTAARAEHSRAARQPVSLDLTLAYGRADLAPEQRVTITGFKPEIDAARWLISEVTDTITDRGYTSAIKLEMII